MEMMVGVEPVKYESPNNFQRRGEHFSCSERTKRLSRSLAFQRIWQQHQFRRDNGTISLPKNGRALVGEHFSCTERTKRLSRSLAFQRIWQQHQFRRDNGTISLPKNGRVLVGEMIKTRFICASRQDKAVNINSLGPNEGPIVQLAFPALSNQSHSEAFSAIFSSLVGPSANDRVRIPSVLKSFRKVLLLVNGRKKDIFKGV
ncbi:hypothetical protein CEXT_718941 [Caerostris extrusa]|uniref:Ribosomal protein S1 n=1 Tax=Caerostris extrusa TaxID=172846 RepID=A0AAV4V3M8_CAEEX|nr:hypothetical protein CEXT_718941 [Caerostris extrusa]